MKSTYRYEILERLGSGGMGTVFRAHDRHRNEEVALKTLVNASPAGIFRFKSEFRALADVVHPNLVALYELEHHEETWFLTMELIRGGDLLAHVRRTTRQINAYAETAEITAQPPAGGVASSRRDTTPLEQERLRDVLVQLANGIHALHTAGKLHCDIKPSNVMVSDAGRVVVLDFGLVTAVDPGPFAARVPSEIIGTIAYMAPEQMVADPLTPAVDWYAFGVMLYEALTGELPFTGELRQIIFGKQMLDALEPRAVVPSAPRDLSDLTVDLLRRDPGDRPGAAEILARLGASAPARAPAAISLRSIPPRPAVFVGRTTELARLSQAFEARARGRAVTVLLSGASGIGKSTLARRFLEAQRDLGPLLVLEGRCYERESMPYKALDSVVDRLSQHLLALPYHDAAALIPPDIDLLTHIFPVLRQVGAAAPSGPGMPPLADPQEHRRRAFAALRELIRRLADRTPLAILIDDLQWGDADSAALLADLFSPPQPPPVLLIACFRADGTAGSPLVRALLERWTSSTPGHDVVHVKLAPLDPAEISALSAAMLADEEAPPSAVPVLVQEIVREAAGSPMFAQELCRYAAQRGGDPSASLAAVRLEDVVRARVAQLDDDERRILEVIAVAGYPIAELVAIAAGGGAAAARRALAKLNALHLVRGRGMDGGTVLEPYHDRIRHTVAADLEVEVWKDRHRAIAAAIRATPDPDPEMLVEHYREADDLAEAARFAVLAAERAEAALAFSRAASLYRLALGERATPGERWALRDKLGVALAGAGRGREAAAAFAEAARDLASIAPGDGYVLELKRRAGEQYLRSGLITEGLAILREVLAAVDAPFPETPSRALARLAVDRAWLRVRGLGFTVAEASRLSPDQRVELDAYWSASVGLSMVDAVRASYFQTRHERLALDLGEPINVARSLASRLATMASVGGAANRRRCAEILAVAEDLARRVADPSILVLTHLCAGTAAFFAGAWREAIKRYREGRRIGRERCVGVTWELDTCDLFELWSLAHTGDLPELDRRVPLILKEARDRDDVFAATCVRIGLPNMVWLARDRPDTALAEATAAMRAWTSIGVHSQHYFELVALVQIALYRGDAEEALRLVEAAWPRLEGALLLRLQSIRIELSQLRARAALAVLATTPAAGDRRRDLLRLTERAEASIAEEDMAWSAPLSALIGAGVAAERGFTGAAVAALGRAADDLDRLDMALLAAAARIQRGHLRGEAGRAEREASLAWMHRQGILAPARMAATLAPIRGGAI